MPKLSWPAKEGATYCVVMFDADPTGFEKCWLTQTFYYFKCGIEGNDTSTGKIIMDLMAPTPTWTADCHRYVILVYEESNMANFCDDFPYPVSSACVFNARRFFL